MKQELAPPLREYLNASNAHDAEAILACFSDAATVRDENETLHGKDAIKSWILKTIEKYDFHFEPLRVQQDDDEAIVVVKVSGTFPGSPVTLDYLFTVTNGKIASLSIE
jgi:ketosteroid isomerase-like protein